MKIQRDFFCGKPVAVARALVGAYLCRRMPDGSIIRARICELELYTPQDRACHAYNYHRTPRNSAMFLCGGHTYIYLCYGLHYMFNIVLGPSEYPAAVLIRALEYSGCDGPAKLTRILGITRAENCLDLCAGDTIWLEPRDHAVKIKTAPRIGIDFAGRDALRPWRFLIATSRFISRPAPNNKKV